MVLYILPTFYFAGYPPPPLLPSPTTTTKKGHFIISRRHQQQQQQQNINKHLNPLSLHPPPPLSPLSSSFSVTCLVVTAPGNIQARARHASNTWARTNSGEGGRGACSKVYFLTSERDSRLENVIVSKYSSYVDLWGKVLDGFHSLDPNSSHWFMKADDDSYLVGHNLVALLSGLDAAKSHYIGLPLIYSPKNGQPIEFNSGGAARLRSKSLNTSTTSTTTTTRHNHLQ
ncbi:hypothetical protein Pmani_037397 [Petrolisthes manimaculis]|uniref:N-acetylgalactosaminide beta-1,3-galactosyltransferase n=1 Tax=Petrolisthes manimaculis TaxID=1843537 RepID=A0AAE1NGC4_9EUCA|nr:hypothetical protein Pmani_037397 [Petrolisthes manimaculis]